jgi:hypothetical protein
MTTRNRHFILLSEAAAILVQVLNAVHALGPADCIVIISKKTRRFSLTNMTCRCIYADFHGSDDDYFVTEINRLATSMLDLTIVPCDCPAERVVDRIGHRLNAFIIPAPNAAMLDCFDNKWMFYQFCKKHELNVPSTRLITCKQEFDFHKASREFGLPIVFKPLDQAGVGDRTKLSQFPQELSLAIDPASWSRNTATITFPADRRWVKRP